MATEDSKEPGSPGGSKAGDGGNKASGASGSSSPQKPDLKKAQPGSAGGVAKAPTPPSAGNRGSKRLPTPSGDKGPGGKTGGAADKADKAGQAADTADKAGKASGGLDTANKGFDGAKANLAGGAAQKAVAGDGSSKGRRNAGRYAGTATSGAVSGAEKGAAAGGVGAIPGAVVGAAKNVAVEGGKDAIKAVKKHSPVAEQGDKRLGAGGTSKESGSGGGKDEGVGSKIGKGVAAGGTAAAAPPVTGLMMLMKLLKLLQMLMLQLAAMVMNAAMGAWGLIMGALAFLGKAVGGPFMFVGGLLAKGAGAMLGVTVGTAVAPAAAATSGAVATVGVVALVGGLLGGIVDSTAFSGDSNNEGSSGSSICTVSDGSDGEDGETLPVDENVEEQAKLVYSAFSEWGMSDENIAGILGNWDAESGIDPTSVQSFPVRTYTMTGEKKSAATNTSRGIGLGQWTGGRNTLLRDYADEKNMDWWTIEAQVAFMVDGDNASDASIVRDMIKKSQGSPGEAALYFHDEWERSADSAGMAERRAESAEDWYGRMSGWEVDGSFAGRIDDIIGGLLDGVDDGVETVFASCDGDSSGSANLTEGGMSMEDATELMKLYNEEGDQVLRNEFHGGGPGQCNGSYVPNCVSFSWYFVLKYTTYNGGYRSGNGHAVAAAMAQAMGKKTSEKPTPYSVFSHHNSSSAGHTGIVLGVDGDRLLIGEAAYCSFEGRARWVEPSEWKGTGWSFTSIDDILTDGDEVKI